MSQPKSELAWTLSDYRAAGVEPPHRIVMTPDATEGDLMSDDEVADLINDTARTLMILRDQESKSYELVYQSFMADMDFLLSIGRIDEDDYNELTNQDNLKL